jgi:hypothetical protein
MDKFLTLITVIPLHQARDSGWAHGIRPEITSGNFERVYQNSCEG